MAEKRTRADMLQLNIVRLDWRYEARHEPELSETVPESASADLDPVQMQEQVRRRAYELFETRGREHGHDREDWLQAEAEILAITQTDSGRAMVAA